MVTDVPMGPEIGSNEEIVGCAETDLMPVDSARTMHSATVIERTLPALVTDDSIARNLIAAISVLKVFITICFGYKMNKQR